VLGIPSWRAATAQARAIAPAAYYTTYSHQHPVLAHIRPGEPISVRTLDALGNDEKGVSRGPGGNPLLGPLYVDGAEAGDAVRIHFTAMRLNRSWGFSNLRLVLTSLLPDSVERVFPNKFRADAVVKGRSDLVRWEIDGTKNTVRLLDPASKVVKLEFDARPMLGCVAVAPPGDRAYSSGVSGTYGGNLDYDEVRAGTTIILPVYHPGALIFLGDAHALQGDGEAVGTGIETSMEVELTVDLVKHASIAGPRLIGAGFIASVGSQQEFVSSLDRALQMATSDMVTWLTTDYKLEPWAAHALIGFQATYRVASVAGSVALSIPTRVLPNKP